MLSSTATVDLIYADNTNARLEIPIVIGTSGNYLPLAGGTMTGDIVSNSNLGSSNNTISVDNLAIAALLFLAQNT